VGTEKHQTEKDQKVEESAPLKFDGTISLSLSNDSGQNLGGRKSATPKAVREINICSFHRCQVYNRILITAV
jgi:hypothetical protein